MDLSAQKEQFSRAYVQAVAAVAGCSWAVNSVDNDSIDFTLSYKGKPNGYQSRSPKLDLQLKCSEVPIVPKKDFSFELPVKNYNELVDKDFNTPRILVVVLVPKQSDDWLTDSDGEVTLRHMGYWASLRGQPKSANTSSVSVQIPINQRFTPAALRTIMSQVGNPL